jgi:NADH-quinone oxidoreductase subunit L
MLRALWLIPMLPLVGVAVNGLLGRRLGRRAVAGIACGVVLAAFLASGWAVVELAGLPEGSRHAEAALGSWLPLGSVGAAGTLEVRWGFALDPLSALMVLVVTGVGLLIHVYSVGYMAHEPDVARFFVYMNLFMSMMLMLVLASNLAVMFVGWEGVGLCSYLLIGFFYDRPFDARTGLSCADAGRKAFVVNRIGDAAFLVGVLYLAATFGTLEFREIAHGVAASGAGLHGVLVGVGLLLFLGACGKSAQIPLYVWLPDAMAGPTPVSALIHAATMVTAGVYMVCRMSALYTAAPEAMAVVAGVGTLTALFAATMGMAATDIKKVLAYSTVSQLGYMFAAAGVGAYVAAMFHLMTHAFFKALLFLGAGSVIHGMSGEQDIRRMGGLRTKMPRTYWTFLMATLAISGIPLFAGFFSKDEILLGAWKSGQRWTWAVLVVAAGLTAFYMFRLLYLVFHGEFRGTGEQSGHVHESRGMMTVPLVILAVLSIAGGYVGIPAALSFGRHLNVLHHWLGPMLEETVGAAARPGEEVALELGLMPLAVGAAVAGLWVAISIYRREGLADRLASAIGPFYRLVRNLYWVDELYDLVILRPFYAICRGFRRFDEGTVDGAVHAVRDVTLGASQASDLGDRKIVDGAVNLTGRSVGALSRVLRRAQTGLVQNYAAVMVFGLFVLIVLYTVVR